MIEIADYDPAWPEAFREAGARLRAAASLIVAVEHIGSTAVRGLAAKSVIDLMPAVAAGHPEHLDACVEPLVALGYVYVPEYEREPGFELRRFFRLRGDRQGRPDQNVHLVMRDGEFWCRHLRFRDLLRADPEAREGYEKLKRGLAQRLDDVDEYTHGKGPFIAAALAVDRE